MSSLAKLTAQECLNLDSFLKNEIEEETTTELMKLVALYPTCPLRRVPTLNSLLEEDKAFLSKLEEVIYRFSGSREKFSMQVLSAYYYSMLCGKYVNLTHESQIPAFESIRDYPKTELSRLTASSIRATCNFLLSHSVSGSTWPVEFWNRGFELSECR